MFAGRCLPTCDGSLQFVCTLGPVAVCAEQDATSLWLSERKHHLNTSASVAGHYGVSQQVFVGQNESIAHFVGPPQFWSYDIFLVGRLTKLPTTRRSFSPVRQKQTNERHEDLRPPFPLGRLGCKSRSSQSRRERVLYSLWHN